MRVFISTLFFFLKVEIPVQSWVLPLSCPTPFQNSLSLVQCICLGLGGGGVPTPGGVQKPCRCGTSGHGL